MTSKKVGAQNTYVSYDTYVTPRSRPRRTSRCAWCVFASAASRAFLLRLSTRAGAAARRGRGDGTEAASHSFEANKENMKTTSALLLACAGSAAAFAPQASNKVRQTKRHAREEEKRAKCGNLMCRLAAFGSVRFGSGFRRSEGEDSRQARMLRAERPVGDGTTAWMVFATGEMLGCSDLGVWSDLHILCGSTGRSPSYPAASLLRLGDDRRTLRSATWAC